MHHQQGPPLALSHVANPCRPKLWPAEPPHQVKRPLPTGTSIQWGRHSCPASPVWGWRRRQGDSSKCEWGGTSSVLAEPTPQSRQQQRPWAGPSWLCVCTDGVLEALGWVAVCKGGLSWTWDYHRAGWGHCPAEAQGERCLGHLLVPTTGC